MQDDRIPRPLADLLLAGVLLTRLPLPKLPPAAFERSARTVWAYPLAGLVVSCLAGGVGYALFLCGLAAPLSAGVTLMAATILTGALHEDGLADVADGFWGGYSRERRLEIMKDSQIGTYGVIALIFFTGLRWLALASLLPFGPASYIACAMLSRAAMPLIMHALPHARASGLAHSVGRPALPPVLVGLVIASGIGITLIGPAIFAVLVLALLATGALGFVAYRKIGGQTGDVLGACQVVVETSALLALTVLL